MKKICSLEEFLDFKVPSMFYEYEYETVHSCVDGCEPYCRCGVIDDAIVTDVYYDVILNQINNYYNGVSFTEKQINCLEAVIKELITVEDGIELYGVPGYYGEEIAGDLLPNIKTKLLEACERILIKNECNGQIPTPNA